jgi:hypothetical protein
MRPTRRPRRSKETSDVIESEKHRQKARIEADRREFPRAHLSTLRIAPAR